MVIWVTVAGCVVILWAGLAVVDRAGPGLDRAAYTVGVFVGAFIATALLVLGWVAR